MISVEIKVGVLTSTTRIHTWLAVTGPDGVTENWGFYPSGNMVDSLGEVRNDSKSISNASSGKMPLTQSEYDALKAYIDRTKTDPPTYSLPSGAQCTNWALAGLAEAGIIPSVVKGTPLTYKLNCWES